MSSPAFAIGPGTHATHRACAIERRAPRHSTRQAGQALIEFAVVAMPILLAGAAIVEVARWQAARMMAGMALLEGARAASTQHGKPEALQFAFEHALRPWFAASGSHRSSADRQRARFAEIEAHLAQAPYRIQIDSPHDGHFARFADPDITLSAAGNRKIINADYVAEQHAKRASPSARAGPASATGDTIFDATTLTLRLTYLHAPLIPGVRAIVKLLGQTTDAFGAQAIAQGFIPIRRHLSLEMHSHPVQWTTQDHAMARVVHTRIGQSPRPVDQGTAPPRWRWGNLLGGRPVSTGKPPANDEPDAPETERPVASPDPTLDPPSEAGDDHSGDAGERGPGDASGNTGDDTDPACGAVICCES